ncbi:magnesium/cobalt transporter CorA [Ancylobacter sp. SL191]|uniref:magnesium/cobalt transporter CorA n=1 Tax=Ancylobacter sp. SL191 TaxID=2995166 RepID=UPI00226E8DB8|nr:magnesium/cobalt transporter CorA [Ancylobacter sp. SL191]WAC28128.1 magnesium/cobalt transporter CorA [Ancylobacter sp. SL191]
MITAYCVREGALTGVPVAPDGTLPPDTIWIDVLRPSETEDDLVESALGIAIPTRDEMIEIEPSSRLRLEKGAIYLTGSLVCNSEDERPTLSAVTFILARHRLVTLRYDEPKPFRLVTAELGRACPADMTGERLLMELLDTIVDRAADIIERLAAQIEALSERIFDREARTDQNQRYRALLARIAQLGDLASKVRESLVSMARIFTFLAAEGELKAMSKDQKTALKSLQRDATSLTDHVSYLGDKITFLLDATLGLVSIEQNNIIKIFAVLSVVLMPPTLIASIYGMNFEHMPELALTWGYPAALIAMLIAAIVPYWIFKWRRWL